VKLADLRRLAVKKQLKIHFRLRNGMECLINDDGVAQVPALRAIPDFSLEDELAAATEFLVEPAAPATPKKVGRDEMKAMASASPAAAPAPDHDDE
jgi:hypothetical protein